MGNTVAGYGVGAVAATLALAFLLSVATSVSFGLLLIGTGAFGVIVLSAALTSGNVTPVSNGTIAQAGNPMVFRRKTTSNGRLTAAIYSTSLVVASFALLVALA